MFKSARIQSRRPNSTTLRGGHRLLRWERPSSKKMTPRASYTRLIASIVTGCGARGPGSSCSTRLTVLAVTLATAPAGGLALHISR